MPLIPVLDRDRKIQEIKVIKIANSRSVSLGYRRPFPCTSGEGEIREKKARENK